MSKSSKNRQRREVVEELRRQAQAAERRRTLTIVAICAVVALIIVGIAGVAIYNENKEKDALSKADLASLGAAQTAAGCTAVQEDDATGTGVHETGSISYDTSPPSYGAHNPSPAEQGIHFYSLDDRPPVEVLVHNLEHGWTIVWYDETVADDSSAMNVLEATAGKFDGHGQDPRYNVIVAPWTSDDGDPIADDKHIAFTHWSIHHQEFDPNAWEGHDVNDGDPPIPSFGESQYCTEFSGAALSDFMDRYPYDDAPEGFLWH